MTRTILNKKWTKPSAKHTKSRLLQLPAELQVMVLNELLISVETIGNRKAYLAPANFTSELRRTSRSTKNPYATPKKELKEVSGYYLYPQILATCQTLCKIGTPVLYGGNRLQLELVTGCDFDCYCGLHCFETAIATITTLCQNHDYYTPYELVRVRQRHSGSNDVERNSEANVFASRFRMYYLVCSATTYTTATGLPAPSGIFALLVKAGLASLFLNRDLIVDHTSRATSAVGSHEFVKTARPFQSLRCKSLKFAAKTSDGNIYESVENVIKGSTPVPDLRTANKNTQDIEDVLTAMVRGPARRGLFHKFHKLTDAMHTYDAQKFDEIRNELMDAFKAEANKFISRLESDNESVANAVKQQQD